MCISEEKLTASSCDPAHLFSCSSPAMRISSAIIFTQGSHCSVYVRQSRANSHWHTQPSETSNGTERVVSLLDSSMSLICQKPFLT